MARIFAKNFRGFRELDINLNRTHFLVGDNSSGKTSILALIAAIYNFELKDEPALDEDVATSRYDFFSPFLDFADVTFGYMGRTKGRTSFGRLMTISASPPPDPPKIVRFTSFSGNHGLTLKRDMGKVCYRIFEIPNRIDPSLLYRLHEHDDEFVALPELEDVEPVELNSAQYTGRVALNQKSSGDDVTAMYGLMTIPPLPSATTTGPVRGFPEPFYQFERRWQKTGSHFPAMLWDISQIDENALVAADRFGAESHLFEKIKVQPLSDIPGSPLLVSVRRGNNWFHLGQVGFGVSQVVPIVVEALYHRSFNQKPINLLQQPELHLHPKAQAAMGEFIHSMAFHGSKFVIETHSDFLMDRFRANMKEGRGEVKARILYCENREDGNHCTTIEINPDGSLLEPPASFKEFFVSELLRTM